jgi:hypothetical protein
MQLPNKLFSYEESVLSKFVPILKALEDQSYSVLGLYSLTKTKFDSIDDFLLALDCLYGLNKIDYDDKEGVLVNVTRNSM